MAETIFKKLKDLEQLASNPDDTVLSLSAKNLVWTLSDFIESGVYTESSMEKFIAKNFRLSFAQLMARYRATEPDKVRNENTVRGQVSRLSKSICSLLGFTPVALYEGFVTNDVSVFSRIRGIVYAFSFGDIDLISRFSFSVEDYLELSSTIPTYDISSCENELRFLKTIDRANLESLMKDVDVSKLAFLISSLKEPLYSRVRDEKGSSMIPVINESKLACLQEFSKVKSHKVKASSQLGVDIEVEDEPQVIEKVVEVPEKIPYNLGINKHLASILATGLAHYDGLSAEKKQKHIARSTDETKLEARRFLYMLSGDGFTQKLNKLNLFDLSVEIERYRKGEE